MEETRPARTNEEMNREYSDLAIQAGDLSFRLEVEKQQLATFTELQEIYLKMDAICRERAAMVEAKNVEG